MVAPCGHPLGWTGLYKRDYDLATPESMAHPAKASWDLAFKILDHLQELGLLKDGATVLDPMAGTGRFLLAACAKGFKAIAVELEPKFVKMLEDNKAYASKKLCLPGFELPLTIIQGDARKLSELLKERGLVSVTSPPYQTSEGESIVRRAEQVVAHSWAVTDESPRNEGYGSTPGQIGSLPDKPIAITSPPYSDIEKRDRSKEASHASEAEHPRGDRNISQGIQGSESNIANLPDRPYVSVTSPPYESQTAADYTVPYESAHNSNYGQAEGQIGQEQGQTYLEAMKLVYQEIAKVADVLVCVVKNPTRAGKLRRLDLDTITLLEATGWRILCHHHAILFEEQEMGHLFEGQVKKPRGRLSFFKRLSYRKGSPVAMWEDVLVAVKNGIGGLCAVTSPPYTEARPQSSWEPQEAWQPEFAGRGKTFHSDTPGQIGGLKDK